VKTLDECVKIYQETDEYISDAAVYENKFIFDNIQDLYDDYIRKYSVNKVPFSLHLIQAVSDWQVDVGFGKDYDFLEEIIDDSKD